jgi:hypothetical protein
MDELDRLRAEVAQLRVDLAGVTRERDILLASSGAAATAAFAASRRPTDRRRSPPAPPAPAPSKLVKLITNPSHGILNCNPHEGMILCQLHLDELKRDHGVDPTHDPIAEDEIDCMGYRCGLCDVLPNPDLYCLSCDKHLHPQWPAVYCSSRCALHDL